MKRILALAAVTAALAFPGQGKAQYLTSTINGQMVQTRDPMMWPFSSDSPWNTPIGSGAVFADPAAPITLNLHAAGTWMNVGTWSHPIYQAAASDPVYQVLDAENNRTFSINVPANAAPDPKSDAHMYIVDPTHSFVTETYGTVINANKTISAKRAFQANLYGKGWFLKDSSFDSAHNLYGVRASDSSGMGGILRTWEIQQLSIHHALTYLLPYANLKHGPVWPSGREDYWGFQKYLGNVPIGQLAAIPPTVDVTKLGLSPIGLALAHALQDYGAYCDDSDGDTLIHWSVEDSAATQLAPATITDMQKSMAKLVPLMLPVMNNSAASPGGGGTPRQPPAPPLAPQPIQ